ncbi:MAG TPA: TIGR01777 family oxidoreductase [Microthrixaceae bacterium]|nr:TIGR01777 family oxidoreductase [Microthrixaceae bacterium]
MGLFTSDETIDHPLSEVFSWHERPGALVRLWPPWSGRVVSEPSNGLQPGSRAVLRLFVPGTLGLVGVEWVAEHVDLEAPNYFSDVMVKGPMRSWLHQHRFSEVAPTSAAAGASSGATRILDEVNYELPIPGSIPGLSVVERRAVNQILGRTFEHRNRQLRDDLNFHAAHPGPRLTIAVSGASGTIGTQLCALLSTGGHRVRRLVRRPAMSRDEITWDPDSGTIDRDALVDVDVVIHLAGRTIGGRFNAKNKRAIYDSRVNSTVLLADAIADLVRSGHQMSFISGSAIGFYGADRGSELLDEDSGRGDGFLAELCRDWEEATGAAAEAGARVVNVRTGIVQTPRAGALAKQLPLFRMGVGGPLGSGSQWLSWISIDDIASVFAHAALTPSISGPLNAAAPDPVTASGYAQILARVLHRPALVPVPGFGPELLLGREGAHEVASASQRVDASLLTESGYKFRQPTLEGALEHVLGR